MRDIPAQLQSKLQMFLQQSMENMFNCLDPAQSNPALQTATAPHKVSITPLSAILSATKSERPIDSTPSQFHWLSRRAKPMSKVPFAITSQSFQGVASQLQVPTSASTLPAATSTSAEPVVAFASGTQVVPQAFANIAKPGYRSGPTATV